MLGLGGRYNPSAPQFRLLKIGLRAKIFEYTLPVLSLGGALNIKFFNAPVASIFLRNAPLRPQRGYISHLSESESERERPAARGDGTPRRAGEGEE